MEAILFASVKVYFLLVRGDLNSREDSHIVVGVIHEIPEH